jgi:small subunit ribosomal protein S20
MAELKRVKDRGPEERLAWRRALLKRKGERKRDHNRLVRVRIASLKRTFRKAHVAGDESKSTETLKNLYKSLDKAAKSGVIHKRTAARRKSRAARLLRKNQAT